MKENRKYRMIHGCYWMLTGIGLSYTTYFLSERGFQATQIGVITAVFGVLAVLLQPVLGRIADRGGRFGWKPQLLILDALTIGAYLGVSVCEIKWVSGMLFGLSIMLVNCMMPLVNSISFYYEKRNIILNYGVARGIGSLTYAAQAMVLGWLTVAAGEVSVPVEGMLVAAVLFVAVCAMPYDSSGEQTVDQSANAAGSAKTAKSVNRANSANVVNSTKTAASPSQKVFFKKYAFFFGVLLGCMLMIAFHKLVNTYLINIVQRAGGDSAGMGNALAIAAVLELPVMFLFSHIVKRVKAVHLLLVAGVSYTLKGILFLCAGNMGIIYGIQLLQMTSYAVYAPASVYFANECMDESDKVTGQAWISILGPAGTVIGNLLGGWLIDMSGVPAMLMVGTMMAACGTVIIGLSAVHYRESRM